jgi:surface carbohydrate biosynthesis protein
MINSNFLNKIKEISFKNYPKKTKIIYVTKPNLLVKKIITGNEKYSYIIGNENRNFNFFVLIKIFFHSTALKALMNENLFVAYMYKYIFLSKPKVVIITSDNNLNLYRIKKYFNNIKFIFIQNGARHKINDIFGEESIKNFLLKNEKCADIIFTFNSSISKYYEKYFKCKTIPIGKFINNKFKAVSHHTYKKKLLYISQFRAGNLKKDHFISHNKKVCSIKKWTEVDRKLLPILSKFCSKNNIELIILGAAKNDYYKNLEKKYFGLYVNNNCKWNYWNKKIDTIKRYEFVNKFEYIACSWSTLGLEMFAKNVKVAFFRQQNISPYNDRNFGWPYTMGPKGFWYTNQINYLEVERVLNNLLKIKKNDWINKINYFKKKIMIYDDGNRKLKKIIKDIIYD